MARQQGLALLARMREGPRQTSMFWRKRAEIGWAGDVARAGRLLKIAHVSEKFPIRGALSRWQLCAARRALRSVCCVGAGPLTCHVTLMRTPLSTVECVGGAPRSLGAV